MKKVIIIFLALFPFYWVGCEEMNDRHQKYLDEGEQVYIGKADSVVGFNGFERVKLEFRVSKDPKLTGVSIYWNSRKDSTYLPIDRSKERFEAIIPIPEGKYNFELEGRSADGGRSITSYVSANSYGADYQGTLYNRVVLSQDVTDDNLLIKWGTTINSVGMYIEYENRENKQVKHFIEDASTETVFTDFVYNGEFKLSTLYIPDDACFDTVRTLPGVYRFPKRRVNQAIDVSNWSVVLCSNFSKPASNMLDGDPNTWWECEYPKWGPFTIIFELDKTEKFDSFWVETQKPEFIKDVKISYAMENNDNAWVYYGTAAYGASARLPETKIINNSVDAAKFIKLEINNRADPQATISGIGINKIVEVE